MDKQTWRIARNAELMDNTIINVFLSEDLLFGSYETEDGETKLRRFVHSEEDIHNPRLLGSGVHGVVVLATIKNIEYALKIVGIRGKGYICFN